MADKKQKPQPKILIQTKPDLVVIYAPDMRPSYDEMVQIKKDCEKNGQIVHLIPPPDKTGKPKYPPEEQTLAKVAKEFEIIFPKVSTRKYTLFLHNHGHVIDGNHYSAIGAFETVSTDRLISLALGHGNCGGLYDASCYSTSTVFQVASELAKGTERDFEFASSSPPDQTAGMNDLAVFVKKLPEYAKDQIAFTPVNLQNLYLLTYSDETMMYSQPTCKRIFSRKESFGVTESHTIDYCHLGDKLTRLIKETQANGTIPTIPESAKKLIPADRLEALTALLQNKKVGIGPLASNGLWGEALILADSIYPGNNASATKEYVALATSKGSSLADNFVKATERTRMEFTENNPNQVLNIASLLENKDAKKYVVAAAKNLAGKNTGELIIPEYSFERYSADTRKWDWAFDDKNELVELILKAKANHTKRTDRTIRSDNMVELCSDVYSATQIAKRACTISEILETPSYMITNHIKNIGGDSKELDAFFIDKIITEVPIQFLQPSGYRALDVLNSFEGDKSQLKQKAAESFLSHVEESLKNFKVDIKLHSSSSHNVHKYILSGDCVELLPKEKQQQARDAIEAIKERDKEREKPKQSSIKGLDDVVSKIAQAGLHLTEPQTTLLPNFSQNQAVTGLRT